MNDQAVTDISQVTYDEEKITLYSDGSMMININSLCIRKPIEEWHKLAEVIEK